MKTVVLQSVRTPVLMENVLHLENVPATMGTPKKMRTVVLQFVRTVVKMDNVLHLENVPV